MLLILTLDTSTPHLVLGLRGDGLELARVLEVGRAHAERLPAELEGLYREAGLPLRAALVVVGTGPGSYTGLRVGASYALGLGRAWGVPVLGVSSLEGLPVTLQGEVAVSLDARKGMVYGASYRVEGGVVRDTLLPPDKYPREVFAAMVSGRLWLEDRPPDPGGLSRNAEAHGQREWRLSYL